MGITVAYAHLNKGGDVIVKIIALGAANYLVLDGDDSPLFEFAIHCTAEDMKRFTHTEIHTLVDRILAEHKKKHVGGLLGEFP